MLTRFIVFVVFIWLVRGSPVAVPGALNTTDSTEDTRSVRSETMVKFMNQSVDPCENFFDFACGNWKTYHPTNRTLWQTRSFINAVGEFDPILTQLLTTVSEADSETERKVKDFYASCMNTASLKATDRKSKLKEILREFGEMPALNGSKWSEQDFDWQKTVAEILNKYGIRIIFGYQILPDWQDHSSNIMILTNQKFEATLVGDYREAYKKTVAGKLQEHLSVKKKTAKKIAKEIVDFEAVLAAASVHTANEDNLNVTTIEEMDSNYSPDLDIGRLVNISFGCIPAGEVVDFAPSYEQALIEALESTPKKVVANYIFYHLLEAFSSKLSASKANLESTCLGMVKTSFARIVSKMFYKANDESKAKQDIEDMWQAIKSIAANTLESSSLSWFDDESREYALEKLHSMKMVIASYEQHDFEAEYSQLTVNKEDYMENLKSLMIFNAMRERASLDADANHLELGLKLVTPTYISKANAIIFPASVLTTEYFWSNSHPNALMFSRLGFLVSHELLHGFSGTGRYFNKLGNLELWWDEEIESKYEERRACLSDQYHNITYGGKPLPQDALQSENAADTGGIVIAYQAYLRWYEDGRRSKEELDLETLPHLNYNSKQLFFINYGQMWCADTQEAARSIFAASDSHSPDEIRAYVPLSNTVDFSKEFNCPKGSPMNPAKKCDFFNRVP